MLSTGTQPGVAAPLLPRHAQHQAARLSLRATGSRPSTEHQALAPTLNSEKFFRTQVALTATNCFSPCRTAQGTSHPEKGYGSVRVQWPLRRAPRPFATAFPTHAVCHVLFPHLILLLACCLPSSLPTHATRESSGTREYTGGVLGGPPNASPPGRARPPARVEGTYANIPPEMCHSPSGTAIACGVEEQAPRKSSGRG